MQTNEMLKRFCLLLKLTTVYDFNLLFTYWFQIEINIKGKGRF